MYVHKGIILLKERPAMNVLPHKECLAKDLGAST